MGGREGEGGRGRERERDTNGDVWYPQTCERRTVRPVLSLCSSRLEEAICVVYSVSAAVPAPQQLVRQEK